MSIIPLVLLPPAPSSPSPRFRCTPTPPCSLHCESVFHVQTPCPPPSASTICLQWFPPSHHPVAVMSIVGLLFEQKYFLGAIHYLALSDAIHVNDTYQSVLHHSLLGYRKTSPKSSPVPFLLITTFPRAISPRGHLPSKSPQASVPLVTQPLYMSVGPFTHSWLYHYYVKPVPLSGFRVSTDRSHQRPHYNSVHSNPAIIAHTKPSYYKCLSFPRLPCCLLPFSFSENLPLEMNQRREAQPLATCAGSR